MLNKKIMSGFEIFTLIFSVIAFSSLLSIPVSAIEFSPNPETQSQIGCCVDEVQGLCSPVSEKGLCEAEDNAVWYDDAFCNINGGMCNKGCCSMGHQNFWETEQFCIKQSELHGIVSEFDSGIAGEIECISISTQNTLGACVHAVGFEDTCSFTSSIECDSDGGEFYQDKLCSNEALDTPCIKQDYIGCLEGRDGIYWYDSCGNPENIYDSDLVKSWNNGNVLSPSQSCNPSSSNSNSDSCGNCDYNDGSLCKKAELSSDKPMDGWDFTCRDLSCEDAAWQVNAKGEVLQSKDRTNGESWCVYDGPIGEAEGFSQDLVGSRHYRYICSNGEVEVDPCQDYRKEICVEKSSDSGRSNAACRVNTWEQCIMANKDGRCGEDCVPKCTENPDCRIQKTNIANDFKFQTCVPKYPPGFNAIPEVSSTEEPSVASGTCNFATRTCIATWKKNYRGKWKVINNKGCHSDEFTKEMNNLCVSLGDCGVYANLMGEPILRGGKVTKHGGKGSTPIQPWILGIDYMLSKFLPSMTPSSGGGFNEPSDILDLISGELGNEISIADPFLGNILGDGGDYGGGFDAGLEELETALAAGGVVAIALTIAVNLGALGGLSGAISILGPLGANPWGLAIVAVVVILSYIFGIGKVKQVEITYTCSPSGPPLGANCDECNGDPLKPCSKYKCQSLGAGCQLINENTGQDECVKMENIDSVPIITPFKEVLNQTMFQYTDVSNNGFRIRTVGNDCISAFSKFSLGVQTDIPALCVIDYEPLEFKEMRGSFLEGNIFTVNHTYILSLPSVETLVYAEIGLDTGENSEETYQYQQAYDEIYNTAEEKLADLNLYVKCMNPLGDETEADYRINTCVKPGPDLVPPVVMLTSPPENSVLSFGSTSTEAIFYTNEPVECKWDIVKPGLPNILENYNTLANTMTCQTSMRDVSKGFYPCNTTLSITNGTNEFYILCRDQPWLGENDSRNIGASEGSFYTYSLSTSESELEIELITPEGTRVAGVEPITIKLFAKTSGGGFSGDAVCGYEIDGENSEEPIYITFFDTGSSTHNQPLQFLSGQHTITVACQDEAGNTAKEKVELNLELDTTAPMVTRVFYREGLTIMTNEEAECYYNLETCSFNIDSGESMTTGISTRHKAEWNPSLTYFVKCKDTWGNKDSGCSIIVRPSQL